MQSLLESEPDFSIVGVAADGLENRASGLNDSSPTSFFST